MKFLSQIKTTVILVVLSVLVLIIGYYLGGQSGLTIAFIITLLFNFISYWYSDKLVLKLYRAEKADYSKYTKLHDIVKEVSIRASIPKPSIYIINSNNLNAFATGRNKKHASIAFTKGIINNLSDNELKGVISHEIAHIKNNDILISTIAAVLAGTLTYIAIMSRFALLFGRERNNNLLAILVLSILTPIIALILRLAISRSREFLADETGSKFIKDSNSLADALQKIEKHPIRMEYGNEATASLFIANPFKQRNILSWFSTHPDTSERVRKLKSLKY